MSTLIVINPNSSQTVTDGIDAAIDLQLRGGFSAIYHAMEEEDVIRIMQHPLAMIETDGDAVGYGIGYPHPRSYGAFARVEPGETARESTIGVIDASPDWSDVTCTVFATTRLALD